MRLIDADEIIYDIDEEGRAFVLAKDIDLLPTVDAVPTEFHDKCQQIEIQKRLKLEEELKDAEPIRHGHWSRPKRPCTYERYCSVCGEKSWYCGKGDYNYCPNCGAMMDLPESMVYPQVEGITPTVVKMDEVTE